MSLIKCSYCNEEISDSSKRCIHCGKKIKQEKEVKEHKSNKLFIILGIVVLLLVAGFVYYKFFMFNILGKWEHYVDWTTNGEVVRSSYSSIEFYKDGTFSYIGYNNTDDSKEIFNGTYIKSENIVILEYELDGEKYYTTVYTYSDKICLSEENCKDYYLRSTSNKSKNLTVEEDTEEETSNGENSNDEINNWIKDTQEDNYVITVFGLTYCSHCANYKPIITSLANEYGIKLYWFEMDELSDSDSEILKNKYSFESKHDYDGSCPYTAITKNGKFITYSLGEMDEESTREFLNSAGIY